MFDVRQAMRQLRRRPDAHKGDFGRVLVLAGSPGFAGAASLCARAALKGGAGLVTLGVPASLLPVAAGHVTACMTHAFPEVHCGAFALGALPHILRFASSCDAVALGPGIGRHLSTHKLTCALVRSLAKPLVVDADGLNNLVGHTGALKDAAAPRVLTPHPGEMARLAGLTVEAVQAERRRVAQRFAREHGVVLALKGHRTVVTDGERAYGNTTGNPGMATGGTGDVLTGLVAALLAQGLDPFEAACLAVYVHGLAGDLAVTDTGELALTAVDLLHHLGSAFLAADKAPPPSTP